MTIAYVILSIYCKQMENLTRNKQKRYKILTNKNTSYYQGLTFNVFIQPPINKSTRLFAFEKPSNAFLNLEAFCFLLLRPARI
jgi:hypothetical protein